MNDIRIPDWQSRGRGFVSLILHGKASPGRFVFFLIMEPITNSLRVDGCLHISIKLPEYREKSKGQLKLICK